MTKVEKYWLKRMKCSIGKIKSVEEFLDTMEVKNEHGRKTRRIRKRNGSNKRN